MKAVITGGTGLVGLAVAHALATCTTLTGSDGIATSINTIVLFDPHPARAPLRLPDDPRVVVVQGDLTDRLAVHRVIDRPDISVFHLGAIFGDGCETDFDRAMRVNVEGTRNVLDACRSLDSRPRVLFASSAAVYGHIAPGSTVDDITKLAPRDTYGMTKAMSELLVNEYSRRDWIDGRGLRLGLVMIRPGLGQPGAYSFVNEQFVRRLRGEKVVIPVGRERPFRAVGTRTVGEGFVRLHEIDRRELGPDRIMNMPALNVTAGDMIDSLDRVANEFGLPIGSIETQPDAAQPAGAMDPVSADRALALGLPQDRVMDDIVRDFIIQYERPDVVPSGVSS